jgi:hypothetical protein
LTHKRAQRKRNRGVVRVTLAKPSWRALSRSVDGGRPAGGHPESQTQLRRPELCRASTGVRRRSDSDGRRGTGRVLPPRSPSPGPGRLDLGAGRVNGIGRAKRRRKNPPPRSARVRGLKPRHVGGSTSPQARAAGGGGKRYGARGGQVTRHARRVARAGGARVRAPPPPEAACAPRASVRARCRAPPTGYRTRQPAPATAHRGGGRCAAHVDVAAPPSGGFHLCPRHGWTGVCPGLFLPCLFLFLASRTRTAGLKESRNLIFAGRRVATLTWEDVGTL